MAGANAAARRGILIRDGLALERAGTITSVVFDKTGTLTHGKPTVVASQVFASQKADSDHLKLAAAVARHSTHPLSQAVAQIFPDTMAGSEHTGMRAAFAGLFEKAYCIVTPRPGSTDNAIRTVEGFWKALGGVPMLLRPEVHGHRDIQGFYCSLSR